MSPVLRLQSAFMILLLSPGALALSGTALLVSRGAEHGINNLYKLDVGTGESTVLIDTLDVSGACFSPDGSRIAIWRGQQIEVMNSDGSDVQVLYQTEAQFVGRHSVSWATDGKIYFDEKSPNIHRVDVETGASEIVYTHPGGDNVTWLQTSRDGRTAAATIPIPGGNEIWVFDLEAHTGRFLVAACQATLSPDGQLVSYSNQAHSKIIVVDAYDGTLVTELPLPGGVLSGQHFSRHSNDYIISQIDAENAYLTDIRSGTFQSVGQALPFGDFIPQLEPDPTLALEPTTLRFHANQGQVTPAPQQVSILNVGNGSLGVLAVETGAPWLAVAIEEEGAGPRINNQVDLSERTVGLHQAEVSVSCTGCVNSPQTYQVELEVRNVPVLDRISVEPLVLSTTPGTSVPVVARLFDQHGDPIAAPLEWIQPASGGVLVVDTVTPDSVHLATLTSDGTEGYVHLVVRSGDLFGTGAVEFTTAIPRYRINCGLTEHDPVGWQADNLFATGGTQLPVSQDIDLAGVLNVGPTSLYQSVRQTNANPHNYTLPLDPGTYLLRLHFAGEYRYQSLDYLVNGVPALLDFDPMTAAGERYRAVVVDLEVAIEAPAQEMELVATSTGLISEAAIEILDRAVPNLPPLVELDPEREVLQNQALVIEPTLVWDDGPVAALGYSWSRQSGPAEVQFAQPDGARIVAHFPVAGEYVVRLTTDDGDLQTHADTTVTVTPTEEMFITIFEPAGGERWEIGSVHSIRWYANALEDVAIAYSIDDGATWISITTSVDVNRPEWESYPWTVPDAPSEQCRIRMAGYFGEAPTASEVFAIFDPSQVDAGADSGHPADATVLPDTTSGTDAGAGDAGDLQDRPSAADGGTEPPPPVCGCRSTPSNAFLFALLGLIAARRRRN